MFCVYTEVMAQTDKLLLNKNTPYFQLLPMSKVLTVLKTHSWGAAFTVTKKSYNT